MELEVISFKVRGEFEGQLFEADYSSKNGWSHGRGICCLNDEFSDSDEFDGWYDRLSEWIEEFGYDAAIGR